MRVWWLPIHAALLLAVGEAGKGRKHRHQKPGRALLDRLASTTVSEGRAASYGDTSGAQLPAPLDAASYATVVANATCGELGPEDYCREMPGKRGIMCGVCEGAEGAAARRHPAEHALDGDHATWWQSPTLGAGDHYQDVALVVTLPDEMELLHVIIKSGPSPRPLAWSVEISPTENGEEWRMVRAFGDKERCRSLWALRPERRRRRVRRAKGKRTHRAEKPACSTQFSSPRPLENGEMHVGLGEGVVARRVRVALRALHAGPPERRFYTVRALTLAARCVCHGHGYACDITRQGAKCECGHGTCGSHCERCCSGAPWSPGQACEVSNNSLIPDDEECRCGERGACNYDDNGVILCVNCTENRAGPLCDRCLKGYYSVMVDAPCLPCDCHPEGSDGECSWNTLEHTAVCRCREGYTGHRCDACAAPDDMFPNCESDVTAVPTCRCDPRGILEGGDVCDTVCRCKPKVTGARCESCLTGYYGPSPDGCRKCYCSAVTDQCTTLTDASDTVPLPLGEGAWLVTDIAANETLEPSVDDDGRPYLTSYEVEGWEDYYWSTESFAGGRVSAYGSVLSYRVYWGVLRGDAGGVPTEAHDVIIVGRDGTRLAFGHRAHESPGRMELTVPLTERGWYRPVPGGRSGDPVSRDLFMDVLSELHTLMLRARFHSDQDEVRLEAAVIVGGELSAGTRETCSCPSGYEGESCERCSWTHVRIQHAPGARPRFECVACACNGHAGCDTVEGACGECRHNTTGPHCERCLPGHYGNPALGPCRPCACPLLVPGNSFSPNCALAAAAGEEFVCTQCPEGYVGDHCETCDFGYWGSPTTPGSSCRPCACEGAPCHRDTGECIQCPPHAEGARCDQCEEGYRFGDPSEGGECVSCECGAGALSAACDARTGQCACREGWTGRACDRCARGHGGVVGGCPMCACGIAAVSATCDMTTGTCSCSPGAAPPACDSCLPEHYALDAVGCTGCNCSTLGSESNACDIRTGQCRCRPRVTGRACDICEEGYWGLTAAGGCRRCECGAGAAACDPVTGTCACAVGVGGAHCDICLPGYYGFGPAGCLPCPKCTAGTVCSPVSGRCVCPARTRGPTCAECAVGAWGRDHGGCRLCGCGLGAISAWCDPVSGQCRCRAGWSGRTCDSCAAGHYGPRCRPCGCDRAGTADCDPDTGLCPCDDDGHCHCKENVVDAKCSVCRDGTFGLTADSPTGCTACFCFGRSAHCTQAGLTRAALHSPGANVTLVLAPHSRTIDRETLTAIHVEVANATVPVPWPPVPLYWELGSRFLGDRVTSYGGMLRFTVREEGGEELPRETSTGHPLVRMYAGHDLVLDYYQRVPDANGTHAVRLHESLWSVRAGGTGEGHASRAALMVALSRVTRVLLRLSSRGPTPHRPVHLQLVDVSLDTAVPGGGRSVPALGVELCACPSPYASSSCQEPAVGFWMPPPDVHVHRVAGTIVIDLEGEARPCRCNGRSTACDPVTGYCLNCTSGTGGPRCERCSEGYHGSPDAPAGCQACPCPERTRNFASSCVFDDGRLQCLCKTGYIGSECESCAPGWTRSAEGACRVCACDVRGALSATCDRYGRCRCREHAAGARCDRCKANRTFLDNDGCQTCDDCSQTLLDATEKLTRELHAEASIDELGRIPKPYPALRQFFANATILKSSLNDMKQTMASSAGLNQNAIEDLEKGMKGILDDVEHFKRKASTQGERARSVSLESMSALEEVLNERAKVRAQVGILDDFARGERHLSAHRALKEARHLLRNIKDVKLIDYIAGANDVFDSANLQSTAIKEYTYRIEDTMRRERDIQRALDRLHARADDVPKMADTVWDAGDAVAALVKRTEPRLANVRDTHLKTRLVFDDVITLAANNLTEETASAVTLGRALADGLSSASSDLEALTLAAEEKEGILYNLTPAYRHKYLEAVERHVEELGTKAKHYKSLFAGSRSAAAGSVDAARAWAEVAEALAEAGARAQAALGAAGGARELARGPVPLLRRAEDAKTVSRDQRLRAEELLVTTDELRAELERLRRGAERVEVALRGLGWKERELAARPRADVGETLAEAEDKADRVFATTRVLYDEAGELRRRARYHLRRQLADLQRHGDTALGAAQELVSQIRGNTLRASEVAGALADAAAARAREHSKADRTLAPGTARLKDNIARARHAADTISVSLSSAADAASGCARAYLVPASSPSVTRISLALSFDGSVRDGPLLWLSADDPSVSGHLKLSVEDRKLKLFWNLGDGEATIAHPAPLEPAHDDADHTSYRIEIERVWSGARLSVERAGGGGPVTVTNDTGGTLGALKPPTALWLGAEGPEGAVGAGLPGCVHALYYDDRRMGLWNFVKQPQQAHCTGCTQRRYGGGARGDPSMVRFDGAGYAELQRSELRPYDRRQFSVSLTFRTRDEDALLFMALDDANNRSVSLFVRGCRVVFRVEYSGSTLEIVAGGRHCEGRPVHVQAIRVFAKNNLEKGSLRVNGDETLGSPEPPVQAAAALPDLAAARYWVGGLPPGAGDGSTPGFGAGSPPRPALLGCLGALLVDREGYDPLDTPRRHGVERDCRTRTLRSMVVEGAGWAELAAPGIRRRASIGVTFRARAPAGLLLLRAPTSLTLQDHDTTDDDPDHNYLALAMTDGQLELSLTTGKGSVTVRSNGSRYDDGELHAVKILRAHKQLELWVDEELVSRGEVGGGGLGARGRGLYVGGVPREVDPGAAMRVLGGTVPGFTGTIADVIFDGTLIGLESARGWSGARLGRADRDPPERQAALTEVNDPAIAAHCTKASSYTLEPGAVRFGDAPHSHATLRVPTRALRDLTLALQFRTFRSQALLLLLPGSKTKTKHYLALTIRDGRLRVIVRGRKRREVSLPAAGSVSDGRWRSVSVRVSAARLVLASGGTAASARAPRRLGLASRLFVGGLPDTDALSNIPDSVSRVGGLVGCVRRVVVNGRAEDLVRNAASHHRVGQCFPNVEPAAHLSGDAYAVWSRSWPGPEPEAETSSELTLQFRTAEPDGLLLAAADFVLEIRDGAVVLSRRSVASEVEVRGAVCDDGWHAVWGRVTRASLQLSVDASPPTRTDDGPLPQPHARRSGPLYLAGLPEEEESFGSRHNFKGCLRDVTVGGVRRDWSQMDALHNVLLDSCPTR